MHNGRETCTRAFEQAALPGAIAFLFSDNGTYNTFFVHPNYNTYTLYLWL